MIYAWRYPKSIHRSVMIGVNPPGNFLGRKDDRRAVAAMPRSPPSGELSQPDADLRRVVKSAFAHVPSHWLFLPIKKGDFQAAAFFGLINEISAGGGPIAAPLTINTLLSAAKGDASGAWFLSLMAQITFPSAFVWAKWRRSAAATSPREHFFASGAGRGSLIGSPGNDLIWDGGLLVNAWPANPDENEYTHVQNSNIPTLLIGGNLDFATPPENATRELLPHLANGREVVLTDLGHADDFWPYQPAAGTRLINTYLDTGKVDTSLYTHHKVDFSPAKAKAHSPRTSSAR